MILLAAVLGAGCAGADFDIPQVTDAERTQAAEGIRAAPRLMPSTRSTAENERIARQVMQRLQRAANPICAITRRGRCWYTLQYAPDGQLNAFIAKNHIVFHDGLAQYMHTEDEFAVVLAHEMGHDIAGHYEKTLQNRTMGAALGAAIVGIIAGTTGVYQYNYQAQSDMRQAMILGAQLGDLSFSKEHEREADYIAAYLMVRAGYNPDVAGKVWVTLAKAYGRMSTSIWDTHPAGPLRSAAWEKAVEEVRYSRDLLPDLQGGEAEPRLQEARIFNDANSTGAASGVALASRGYGAAGAGTPAGAQALAPAAPRPTGAATWIGHAPYDSCGKETYLKLETKASKLRGNMWWNGVKYDVYGKIDTAGRVQDARAGKSREAQALPAPRFFRLEIRFAGEQARGRYTLDGESAACQAEFLLGRD